MGFTSFEHLFSVLFILFCYLLHVTIAIDTITSSQFIKDPQTLLSKDANYSFGFFSPQNSTYRYVGIWWKSQSTIIWVANRNHPLNDSNGVATISEDGNLVILNGQKHVIWSSNISNIESNTTCQFSDFGNIVLSEITTENILWQSSQHPSDILLSGMKLSINKRTGEKSKMVSWKSPSDPSLGSFSCGTVERTNILEVFIWNETRPYWRSGPWNGGVFTGIDSVSMTHAYFNGFQGGDDGEGNINVYFTTPEYEVFLFYKLTSQGKLETTRWDTETEEMQVQWTNRKSECDGYNPCGPFAICSSSSEPICSCLNGFEASSQQEWNRNNWTNGCVRRVPLQCEKVKNEPQSTKKDGFLKLQMVKVPDFVQGIAVTPDMCRSLCLENCSCTAYSNDAGIGCMSWTGNLLDIKQLQLGGLDLYFRVAHDELDCGSNKIIIITIPVIIGIFIILISAYIMWKRTSKNSTKLWPSIKSTRVFHIFSKGGTSEENISTDVIGGLSRVKLQELLLFDFEKLATATNHFHLSNKLGEGGFGPVYKGKLQDGQEIAVKRLSRASGQGLEEFMNEVFVICKLQHRNLVRLLGCCIEGDEKMLVYEYMPNKSLDAFIFDLSKNKLLDWRTRYSIIEGIGRGLLYLHRDSRLKIIHRDMKASNILLDEELNPKISDFGMARIFGEREERANTTRVVGTYGYMSPEYAMQGLFSEKSDVFSFGVLILEIVTGRRNSSFYENEALTLLGFIWIQWREEATLSLIDAEIYDTSHHMNILRCIHIGLLCVQESAVDRPNMATVVSMLNNEAAFLPPPTQPAFILRQHMMNPNPIEENQNLDSINTVSNTDISGR